jgi:hypothetical protein
MPGVDAGGQPAGSHGGATRRMARGVQQGERGGTPPIREYSTLFSPISRARAPQSVGRVGGLYVKETRMARQTARSTAPQWVVSLDFRSDARSGKLVGGVAAQDAMVALFDDFADEDPAAQPAVHVSEASASTHRVRTRAHP